MHSCFRVSVWFLRLPTTLLPYLVFLIRDLPHLTQSLPRLREIIL